MSSSIVPHQGHNWQNPDLALTQSLVPAPPFPRHVLGDDWASWCEATAGAANAPFDYVAASLITTAASLMGNSTVVAFGGWQEPAIAWSALVGSPSAKKSPAMAPLKRIIGQLESELVAAHDPDEGPIPQLRVGDVTAQAAAEVSANNKKGVLLQLDELDGFWKQTHRTGGEQFMLEAFGGGSYTVNRKGKATVKIAHLSISVLGTVQPDPLRDLLSTKTDRGFAARYLYIYPEPISGFQRPKHVDQEVAISALRHLRDLPMNDGTPKVCPLNTGAEEAAETWLRDHLKEEDKAHGAWAQWLGKQSGMLLRYALVLQHLWWCIGEQASQQPPQTVDVAAIHAAADFIDAYAKPMAARCFGTVVQSTDERQAAFLANLLQRQDVLGFNARELRRGSLGPVGFLASPDHMRTACAALESAHLIRKIGTRAGGGKGRGPGNYEVNPALRGMARASVEEAR